MLWRLFLVSVFTVLAACQDTPATFKGAKVLVMGDSMMAYNRLSGASVADQLQARLNRAVADRSVSGAAVVGAGAAGGIAGQYVPQDWDWVVLNGYGNDLLWGCGCRSCADRMTRLIAPSGESGAIPDLVTRLRADGTRVIYTGYLRTPGFASPVERCAPLGAEMDRRIARLADRDPGVFFLDLATVVPSGDTSFHRLDRVHPSPKGSAAIAERIVALMAAIDQR
ncbi:SGNH/GDSL hydrolase family protein [Salibaculum halophilum]|uniref:SGNH/GDSL hydrolase family protein n=1 Tax=Salibaculum halophilum TaxID=1914408 RepID=UPI000A10DFCE|nr:SGNH/GDSL hydrolase family protein [Salibaculum halophilum]